MKLFPETVRDYLGIFVIILVLWAIGIGVAFIPGNCGKNLSSGIGLGNSLISLAAVILVVGNYARQQEQRIRDEGRGRDFVIQTHFFQLLSRLPDLLPADEVQDLLARLAPLGDVLKIYFREAGRLQLNREKILQDLPGNLERGGVSPAGRFRRQDLLRALQNLRTRASDELKPLLDQSLRTTLSDEQRRLLILQTARDGDLQGLTFLGAAGVIGEVLTEMELPELSNFLVQAFPADSPR